MVGTAQVRLCPPYEREHLGELIPIDIRKLAGSQEPATASPAMTSYELLFH
jgi:hypothetical protein